MLFWIKHFIWQAFRIHRLKKDKVFIHWGAYFNSATRFETNIKVNRGSRIKDAQIGKGTYIEKGCLLNNCRIGSFCSLGMGVNVIYGRHPSKVYVSTHPAFFSKKCQSGFSFVKQTLFEEHKLADEETNTSVIIGNDVWLGTNVGIMEGVTIGDGAIVGAYSLVTKDIEPYSINFGVPSKKYSYRFSEEDIDFIKSVKWWEYDLRWLADNADKFSDIKKLKHFLKNGND